MVGGVIGEGPAGWQALVVGKGGSGEGWGGGGVYWWWMRYGGVEWWVGVVLVVDEVQRVWVGVVVVLEVQWGRGDGCVEMEMLEAVQLVFGGGGGGAGAGVGWMVVVVDEMVRGWVVDEVERWWAVV